MSWGSYGFQLQEKTVENYAEYLVKWRAWQQRLVQYYMLFYGNSIIPEADNEISIKKRKQILHFTITEKEIDEILTVILVPCN